VINRFTDQPGQNEPSSSANLLSEQIARQVASSNLRLMLMVWGSTAALIIVDVLLQKSSLIPVTACTHALVALSAVFSGFIGWRCQNQVPLMLRAAGLGHSCGSPFNSIGYVSVFSFFVAIGYVGHIGMLLGWIR